MEIKKIYHVMLRFHQNTVDRYLVYDGPGINSPTICKRNNIYQCSSFKCVVQVLNNSTITNYSLKYNSSLLKSDQTYNLYDSEDVITFTSNKCTQIPCVIQITAPTSPQVNVPVTKITYVCHYLDSSLCQYGRIVVFEKTKDNYEERYIFCENHHKHHNHSRSFYSRNSSLTLVLYCYHPYCELYTELHISTTSCTAVSIQYFTNNKLCAYYEDYPSCNSFLSNLITSSEIKLKMDPVHSRKIILSFSKDGCAVLQFYESPVNESLLKRENLFWILFGVDVVVESAHRQRKIVSEMKGILEPHEGHYFERLTINEVDEADYFYHYLGTEQNNYTNKFKDSFGTLSTYKDFHVTEQSSSKHLNFLILTQFAATFNASRFLFGVHLLLGSHSWVDMIINRRTQFIDWETLLTIKYRLEDECVYGLIFTSKDSPSRKLTHTSFLVLTVEDHGEELLGMVDLYIHTACTAFSELDLVHESQLILKPENYKFISLPGIYYSVKRSSNETMTVKAFWIHTNYDKYGHFADLKATQQCKIKAKIPSQLFCYTFPSNAFRESVIKRTYLYFINLFYSTNITLRGEAADNFDPNMAVYSKRMSWEAASKVCQGAGGRAELEEFITLVK